MRTLGNIWETFNNKFSNFPMSFHDDITGDGVGVLWELTFYPLSDETAYKPTVSKNVGTYASPSWVILTENTDYTIDYSTGHLKLVTPPPLILDGNGDPTVSLKVDAHHVKINLKQFVQFFNEATAQMNISWPIKKFSKVNGADIGMVDGHMIDTIDLSHPFYTGKKILEIFQTDRDRKHIPFRTKGESLFFDQTVNDPRVSFIQGPSDYNRISTNGGQMYVNIPFYISYLVPFPLFTASNINTVLSEDSFLSLEDGSETNMVMRIGISMYSMREHWSERVNASTLRMSSLKDIQMTKQGLSMELMRHTGDNAPGRGNTPPTTTLI